MEQTTKLVDGRYEVGLPWAEDNPKIENNYFSAHSEFCSLEKRFEKDLSFKARYQETIRVDLQNDYVTKLDEEKLRKTKEEMNPHKPQNVRRVCNAAAKFRGNYLNDMLLLGPDLLQNLVGIIFRFREHRIALTADIKAMFLQVEVPPQDCKMLIFHGGIIRMIQSLCMSIPGTCLEQRLAQLVLILRCRELRRTTKGPPCGSKNHPKELLHGQVRRISRD